MTDITKESGIMRTNTKKVAVGQGICNPAKGMSYPAHPPSRTWGEPAPTGWEGMMATTIEQEMDSQREELLGGMQDEDAARRQWVARAFSDLMARVPGSRVDLAKKLWVGTHVVGDPVAWLVAFREALVESRCLDRLAANQVDLVPPMENKLAMSAGDGLERKG